MRVESVVLEIFQQANGFVRYLLQLGQHRCKLVQSGAAADPVDETLAETVQVRMRRGQCPASAGGARGAVCVHIPPPERTISRPSAPRAE